MRERGLPSPRSIPSESAWNGGLLLGAAGFALLGPGAGGLGLVVGGAIGEVYDILRKGKEELEESSEKPVEVKNPTKNPDSQV